MEDKKNFGEFISLKRKELGLTQKGLAEQLFVTESAVSKWERGLSYPDITLIRDICKVLGVSEHELLTASEDAETRNLNRIAQKHISIVNGYKKAMIVIYSITIFLCFILNIAIQHTLSWFFIVFTSVMIAASLTLVPIMKYKNKSLVTLGAFTISLTLLLATCNIYTNGNWFGIAFVAVLLGLSVVFLPFVLSSNLISKYCANKKTLIYFLIETGMVYLLLLVCNLYSGGGWFFKTAVPITTFSMTLPWGMMLVIRYTKINKFFKTSACLILISIFHYYINGFISYILGNDLYDFGFRYNFSVWNEMTINGNVNMIIFFVLIGLAVVFAVLGIFDLKKVVRINNKLKV